MHAGVDLFNYNPAIDWAIHMIGKGIETENMLIIASFSKPVDREEIKPFISGVLRDLNLEEKENKYSIATNAYYHVQQIIDGYEIRKNLTAIFDMHLANRFPQPTMPFYLLYHAWDDLDSQGFNYYYEGATLENIESVLKLECENFISDYIDKIV